jgi:hypothetical protein
MTKPPPHTVKCPAPDCAAVLRVRDGLPPGEYRCHCWATYLGGERKPYVGVVEKREGT